MAENEKDMENGDAKRERISFADGWDPEKVQHFHVHSFRPTG